MGIVWQVLSQKIKSEINHCQPKEVIFGHKKLTFKHAIPDLAISQITDAEHLPSITIESDSFQPFVLLPGRCRLGLKNSAEIDLRKVYIYAGSGFEMY